jgi:DNA-binding Lrp family transcriptional regulator
VVALDAVVGILVQAEAGKAGQVARAAAEVDGVQQAQPLAGPYDVIVRAEAPNIDALGGLVLSQIQAIHQQCYPAP